MSLCSNILGNKKILILIFVFITYRTFGEPRYCKLSDRILFPYNKELFQKYRLALTGHGGAMMNDIQKVNAYYVSFQRMTVEEARRLYVDVIEGFLCRYNQNEEIRPYLHSYPFTIDNLHVRIGFEDEQRKHMSHGFVALMFVGKNQWLIYRAYDPVNDKFVPLYEEPYETARDIVLSECR